MKWVRKRKREIDTTALSEERLELGDEDGERWCHLNWLLSV